MREKEEIGKKRLNNKNKRAKKQIGHKTKK